MAKPSFESQLNSILKKYDETEKQRQELAGSEEAARRGREEFSEFKERIKPLLEQVTTKLEARGYTSNLREAENEIGLEVGDDNYLGFRYKPGDTLAAKIGGQPMVGRVELARTFGWRGPINDERAKKAILAFVDTILTTQKTS